jgi:hypothetical protein
MKNFILLVFILCVVGFYFNQSPANRHLINQLPIGACSRPLVFHLGHLDSRFNLDPSQTKWLLQRAAKKWNKAAGKELLRFDEIKGFPVDFVFDNRQQNMLAFKQSMEEINDAKLWVEERQMALQQQITAYENLHNAYQQAISELNRQIAIFNSSYYQNRADSVRLNQQADILRKEQVYLNQQYNQLTTQQNQYQNDINYFNQLVATHNLKYGTQQSFTQSGVYRRQGNSENIEIYQFNDNNDLLLLLMHELGHALGLEHLSSAYNIMSANYSYNFEAFSLEPQLTNADIAAVKRLCNL